MRWHFGKLRGQWLPGAIAGILISLLWLCHALLPLEHLSYNLLFQIRGERPLDERVVVIKIDDESIRQIGRYPWNRKYYTQLLKVLTNTEVNAIAFDILMPDPTPEDKDLAKAMVQQGKVILAQAPVQESHNEQLRPVPILRSATVGNAIGHIRKEVDADGVARKTIRVLPVPAQNPGEIEQLPALALASFVVDSLMQNNPPIPEQPLLWINWGGASKNIQSYSFVEVIQGKVPLNKFTGKIVLVGITATGFDPLITPFDRNPPTSGVYLQATLVSNLLQQNALRVFPESREPYDRQPWDYLWGVPFLVFGGLLWSRFLSRFRTPKQVAVTIVLCVGWIILSFVALVKAIWIPSITPFLLFVATLISVILYERLSLNKVLYQQVQQLWNAYYEDLVMGQDRNSQPIVQRLSQQPVSMQRAVQLATLAEQFGQSHAAQAAIARSLTLGLLAADLEGTVWFCNPPAAQWLQTKIGDVLYPRLVPTWLQEEHWKTILQNLDHPSPVEVRQAEQWFELTFEPLFYHRTDHTPRGLLLILEDITQRKEAAIAQVELNQRLSDRTLELELVNQELEAFSYAVSHDLRAPLRRIRGFTDLLLEDNAEQLDEEGTTYLHRIDASAQRMGELIENLLNLSRVVRYSMSVESIDISAMIDDLAQELHQSQPDRRIEFVIQPNLTVKADRELLRIALDNLVGNAWKYTSKKENARIEFGVMASPEVEFPVFFIRDNGAGFDMTYSKQLFSAFQRLHTVEEFPGTGIGLMTTRRIIHRHRGRIWAEGVVDQGATFYFTLPA
jgi:CHASE2 domain-containing sensor protein/nitrogen-specific signal transduction histidine kinase